MNNLTHIQSVNEVPRRYTFNEGAKKICDEFYQFLTGVLAIKQRSQDPFL